MTTVRPPQHKDSIATVLQKIATYLSGMTRADYFLRKAIQSRRNNININYGLLKERT
ncbi:MAG: hypothetical protein LBU51_08125 [Bacteroidales bacterium]|nr:hypothetical protein [Bacteroidales bacterium]